MVKIRIINFVFFFTLILINGILYSNTTFLKNTQFKEAGEMNLRKSEDRTKPSNATQVVKVDNTLYSRKLVVNAATPENWAAPAANSVEFIKLSKYLSILVILVLNFL